MAREQKPKKKQPTEAEQVAIVAGALAMAASAQATANAVQPSLGIPMPSVLFLILLAKSRPMSYGIATLPSAGAAAESQQLEATYRAHYVVSASRRLKGLSGERLEKAKRDEKRYFDQHLDAMKNRKKAATAVDRAKVRYGKELGWYAKMDAATSDECRQANGKNFSPERIPGIGFPGAVHPRCRCKPGRRHATSQTVYSIKPRKAA